MANFIRFFIIGTDLNGRKCRVAQVLVPAHFTNAEALRYIQRERPEVSEIERD